MMYSLLVAESRWATALLSPCEHDHMSIPHAPRVIGTWHESKLAPKLVQLFQLDALKCCACSGALICECLRPSADRRMHSMDIETI